MGGRIPTALLMGLLAGAQGVAGEETRTDDPEALALELLEVTGAARLGLQVLDQMLDTFKASDPSVPPEFWEEFRREVDVEEVTRLVVPVYTEHFTAAEMSAAIDFYRTPAGQAIIAKLPIVMQESMAAGQAWGAEVGRRAAERLQQWKAKRSEAP